MVSFIALYKQPADAAAFDTHFYDIHKPLCEKVPNLLKLEVTKVTGTPRGPSEYYMIVTMHFADQQTMMDALMGEAGMATAKDARVFASGIFTGIFGEAADAARAVV